MIESEQVVANVLRGLDAAVIAVSGGVDSMTLAHVAARHVPDNVIMAHIHLAPEGVNGPVVAFLLQPQAPGGGPSHGVIATGTIRSSDLLGPLAGMTLADLISAMQAGTTYANVHTDDGVAPPNTGPGDFPGGEVRGQIH